MLDLYFEDLSAEDIELVVGDTGCGSKGADVPDFIFLEACQRHDLDYWIGGDEASRKAADIRFWERMVGLAKEQVWWKRYWYLLLARIYYWGVRLGGNKFFWYGNPRGRSELDEALEVWRSET